MEENILKANNGKKKKRRFSVLVTAFVVAFAGYLTISLCGLVSDIKKAKNEYAAAENELAEIVAENEELEALLSSDGYVERIAREKYDYVAPGEEVFADLSGN